MVSNLAKHKLQLKIDSVGNSEAVFRMCSVEKMFLEISQNSQEKSCFAVNFAKFLRTPLFTEHLRWLLLIIVI